MFSMYKRNRQIPIAKKLEIIEYSKVHGIIFNISIKRMFKFSELKIFFI